MRITLRALLGALIIVAVVPGVAFGVSRGSVLARGKVWVDRHVPYSQSRYAKVNGTLIPTSTPAATAMTQGYRTDCSGFVSMCLSLTNSKGLPLSLSTATFRSVLTTISKDELLPGDVILRPSTGWPYGHAVVFVRWADSAHSSYWTYEESGSKNGSISRRVTYPFFTAKGFRAYRYKKIDDYFADCQETVYGPTNYDTAVAASRAAYPATCTVPIGGLVVASDQTWTGNLSAAALAGAAGGPLLLTKQGSLPATAAAVIQRLKPATVYVIGGPSLVSTAVSEKIASMGPKVVRVSGRDRFANAVHAAHEALRVARGKGRVVNTAYLVGTDSFGDGLAVSPIAAKTGRPILLASRRSITPSTLKMLKADRITRVVIIGPRTSVDTAVSKALKRRGIVVTRVAGRNSYETARAVANHGAALRTGLSWSHVGVASGSSMRGTLACGVAQGQAGSLLLLTPAKYLCSSAATEIEYRHATIGKVRVFGNYSAVGSDVRISIAKLMRAK